MEPSVSVIMAVHNGERHVQEAVDSVLAQTLPRFELIIVEDASTDATPQILAGYTDSRIRLLRNPRCLGPAAARNRALRIARAPLLAIQDADDSSFPHRLQRQAQFLARNPAVALVGAHALSIGEDSREVGLISYPPASDLEIKWALLFFNPFIHTSVMIRRSALQNTGFFNEQGERAWLAEDYELLSRINRKHRTANICEVLVKYRINPAGLSARSLDLERLSGDVSRNNLSWLLGGSQIDLDTVCALRQFWFQSRLLSAAGARRAVAWNEALHRAFLSRYVLNRMPSWRRARFCWRRFLQALAQARRNPQLDRSTRLAMILSTMLAGIRVAAW